MADNQANIAELVARMPATDKELAEGKPSPKGDWESEGTGSKFTGPDPAVTEKIVEEIYRGGRASLLELLNLVKDPGGPDYRSYKAEYLVHCLVISAGRPNKEAQRKLIVEALASQLNNPQAETYTRNFFVRELQSIGDKTAVPALAGLLTDPSLCAPAAAALLSINDGVVEPLRAALPNATGYRRLVVLQSLAVLKDLTSAAAFRSALTDADRQIRLAGAWGLAQVGDASAADALLRAADAPPSFERIKATQACLLLAENLVAAGNKKAAIRIYTQLRDSRTDPKEKYIRDLSINALETLTKAIG
jgi:HEAT repeat protein